jgi:hypothetical protein
MSCTHVPCVSLQCAHVYVRTHTYCFLGAVPCTPSCHWGYQWRQAVSPRTPPSLHDATGGMD